LKIERTCLRCLGGGPGRLVDDRQLRNGVRFHSDSGFIVGRRLPVAGSFLTSMRP
jgi:hypothetical protein